MRGLFALVLAVACCAITQGADTPVVPGYSMSFPRDDGSHPTFATEWWYITGWLKTTRGTSLGFQITFFRSRTAPEMLGGNPSAFAPAQLLAAHAALSDPRVGHLLHGQRVARSGFGLAQASTDDTAVFIDRWQLRREQERYVARVVGEEFAFDLTMNPVQVRMINGEQGYSRKSRIASSASYYYSVPHLKVGGKVRSAGSIEEAVVGEAWLDHEWSSAYLDADAVGWDWIGVNFDDGSALMAFRIRGAGNEQRWAGGTFRDARGNRGTLAPDQVHFEPQRGWRSTRTGITYPVQWRIVAGDIDLELSPLMDDQENDARASSGAIYWEGAVDARVMNRSVGRGYLELTGYGQPLQLR